MADMKEMNNEELEQVAGGKNGLAGASYYDDSDWKPVRAKVKTGYLALRTYPSYDYSNEIAKIWNGESFTVNKKQRSGSYIWANYKGMQGWVNGDYIVYM